MRPVRSTTNGVTMPSTQLATKKCSPISMASGVLTKLLNASKETPVAMPVSSSLGLSATNKYDGFIHNNKKKY